jgi:hypothetical protein
MISEKEKLKIPMHLIGKFLIEDNEGRDYSHFVFNRSKSKFTLIKNNQELL